MLPTCLPACRIVMAAIRSWSDVPCRWGLKHIGITAPDFSWLGPKRVPINMVVGAPIKVRTPSP